MSRLQGQRSTNAKRAGALVPVLLAMLVVSTSHSEAEHRWHAHWKRPSGKKPVSIELWNQIGPDAAPLIRDVIAKWGSVRAGEWYPSGPARSDFSFTYVEGRLPSCHPDTFRRNVVVFCLAGDEHAASEAHIKSRGNHIFGGIIHIQDVMRRAQGVYCHEFGHALGLDHSVSAGTCMSPRASTTTPDQHDLDFTRDIIAHKH